jgi:2-polyprenyl-3-methyl-5-hydroxy-6-metoxy-1,4-benzoquinol methylase
MVEHTPIDFDPAIKAYYDQSPEESRLEQWSRLEEARSRELILRYAPPAPALVLDVGGAAGAYAFWLAEQGYEVRLFDATRAFMESKDRDGSYPICPIGGMIPSDAISLFG